MATLAYLAVKRPFVVPAVPGRPPFDELTRGRYIRAMTPRERFQAVMNFQPFDRLPLVEWAEWWDKTIDRWHTEDLPADVEDRYDICRHFGLEVPF